MNEPNRNRWRGVPAGARAAERRALLVEVAFGLVGTEGMAGTTVRRVCEEARLNPRYFYESFADLDELLVAVFDRTALEAVAVMVAAVGAAEAVEGTGSEEVLRVGIRAFVGHVTEDARRARVLFMEGFNNEALGRRRFDSLHEMAANVVDDATAGGAGDGGPGDPPSIVVVAANLMVGGLAELVMSFVMGRLDVTLDELVDDTASIFTVISRAVTEVEDHRRAPAS